MSTARDHEEILLGWVLKAPGQFEHLLGGIEPCSWSHEPCRHIAEAIRALKADGTPVSFSTVFIMLKRLGLGEVTGADTGYLQRLTAEAPISLPEAVAFHADRVRARGRYAAVRAALANVEGDTEPEPDQMDAWVRSACERVQKAALRNASTQRGRTLPEAWASRITQAEREAQESADPRRLLTGIPTLDNRVAFRPGRLAIIAATPGMGKSAFKAQLAEREARRGGHVLYASMEMPAEELAGRLAVPAMGMSPGDLDTAKMTPQLVDRMRVAGGSLPERFHCVDEGWQTVEDIANAARAHAVKYGGVGGVFVDYLQKVRASKHTLRQTRDLQLEHISGSLKALAMELDCPVVVGSQLSREQRKQGRKPRLDDLRGSGAIEQDADIVIFIHSEDGEDDEHAELLSRDFLLRKQRGGINHLDAPAWFRRADLKFIGRAV